MSATQPQNVELPGIEVSRRACASLFPLGFARAWELVVLRDAGTSQAAEAVLSKLLGLSEASADELIWHDSHHAPYVLEAHPEPQGSSPLHNEGQTLISLTDEANLAAALAAIPARASKLAGVGVDIALTADFELKGRHELFYQYLFTPDELAFVHSHSRRLWPRVAAVLFSAKESVVKSVSPLVRDYEGAHPDSRLHACIRDVELTLRDGYALPLADAELAGETFVQADVRVAGETGLRLRELGVLDVRAVAVAHERAVFSAAVALGRRNRRTGRA